MLDEEFIERYVAMDGPKIASRTIPKPETSGHRRPQDRIFFVVASTIYGRLSVLVITNFGIHIYTLKQPSNYRKGYKSILKM